MKFRRVTAVPLLFLVTGCGANPRSEPTPDLNAATELPRFTADTTVRVEQGGLELLLRLSRIPRRIGEMVVIEYGVRNAGDAAREIVVPRCHLFSRGVKAVPEIECQIGPGPVTLQPGESWSARSNPRFEGPAGHHRFEVQAVLQPSAWIEIDLDLAP